MYFNSVLNTDFILTPSQRPKRQRKEYPIPQGQNKQFHGIGGDQTVILHRQFRHNFHLRRNELEDLVVFFGAKLTIQIVPKQDQKSYQTTKLDSTCFLTAGDLWQKLWMHSRTQVEMSSVCRWEQRASRREWTQSLPCERVHECWFVCGSTGSRELPRPSLPSQSVQITNNTG